MKIEYAIVSEQGLREEMEDTHCFLHPFAGNEKWLFAGVCDGHRGRAAAEQGAKEIPPLFLQKIGRGVSVRRAFQESYQTVSDSLASFAGGTCALTLFLRPPVAFFANAGDCTLCVFRGGRFDVLTKAHRVGNLEEEARVRSCGGDIRAGYVWVGSEGLQPLRSIGDACFKKVGVIAEPECGLIHMRKGACFLLGTDGVFDVVSLKVIEAILRSFEGVNVQAAHIKVAIESAGSRDNYTFILLSLSP